MTLAPGTHQIGPANGSLRIRTGREGAASKAGHDLLIEVTDWSGTVQISDSASVSLSAEPGSLQVLEGTGGVKPLSDKDKGEIKKGTADKVLGSATISFTSSAVQVTDTALEVSGELTVAGRSAPTSATLPVGSDGEVGGEITVRQSDFAIKQYKALMGALKVADEVTVQISARLPTA